MEDFSFEESLLKEGVSIKGTGSPFRKKAFLNARTFLKDGAPLYEGKLLFLKRILY